MNLNKMRLVLLLFLCFFSGDLFAQTAQQIEVDLLKAFKSIDSDKGSYVNASANDIFIKKLYNYTSNNPVTISYHFTLLKREHMDINTSDDGLFRIYSWDTWTGGTMHFFDNVFQYKSGNKIYAIIDTATEGDVEPSYYKLYTFKTPSQTYYLAVNMGVESSKYYNCAIQVFSINNGKLNRDTRIIKTHTGLHSILFYEYDFGSVIDWKNIPDPTFDNTTQTIHIPIVASGGKMTHNYITYKFNGQCFERVKS